MMRYLERSWDLGAPSTVSIFDEMPLWSALSGQLLLSHVPLGRGLSVLDVGCGAGFPLLELAERLGPSSTLTGLDSWEAALRRAREKHAVLGLDNVRLVHGDAAEMPFPDGSFDLVVSNLGLNNFADADAAMRECRRVLRPGGRLALCTNLQGTFREFYEAFDVALADLRLPELRLALSAHIEKRTTPERLAARLAQAGLLVERLLAEEAAMRFFDGTALLSHHFIQLGFLADWRTLLPAAAEREIFARLEERLNQAAAFRDELRLTVPLLYCEAQRPEG
jgi:ubiquinone/menaquinone biosynthesis C-methylase UbiE